MNYFIINHKSTFTKTTSFKMVSASKQADIEQFLYHIWCKYNIIYCAPELRRELFLNKIPDNILDMQALLDEHNDIFPDNAIVGLNDDELLQMIHGLVNTVEEAF